MEETGSSQKQGVAKSRTHNEKSWWKDRESQEHKPRSEDEKD